MVIKRLSVWLGTFLGLVLGVLLVVDVFVNEGNSPLVRRLVLGAVGCYMLWHLGGGLARTLKKTLGRTP